MIIGDNNIVTAGFAANYGWEHTILVAGGSAVLTASQQLTEIHMRSSSSAGGMKNANFGIYDITDGTSGATLVTEQTISVNRDVAGVYSITGLAIDLSAYSGRTLAMAYPRGDISGHRNSTSVNPQSADQAFNLADPFVEANATGSASWYGIWAVTEDITPTTSTASRPVTNVAAGAVQTFQVMAAGVNKTAGEGLGGSDLVLIEDNHQVTVPLVVDGVTITIDSDTLDYQLDQTEMAAAGNSITFDAVYYSPAEEQASKIAVTVTAPGGGGSGSRTMTAWIEANGAGGQVNDAWITYLKAAGASGMTFNELMFSWLGGLGYTGSLSDRVAAWSKVSLN